MTSTIHRAHSYEISTGEKGAESAGRVIM